MANVGKITKINSIDYLTYLIRFARSTENENAIGVVAIDLDRIPPTPTPAPTQSKRYRVSPLFLIYLPFPLSLFLVPLSSLLSNKILYFLPSSRRRIASHRKPLLSDSPSGWFIIK